MSQLWLPIATLWWREIVRFRRQRSRLIGAVAQPLVFWLLLGGGLTGSFRAAEGSGAPGSMAYFFPGIVVMVLLFTAIFATISTVEDRQRGFLQGALVAPVSPVQIVLGQALGGATLALVQGTLFLALAPLIGISFGIGSALAAVGVLAAVAVPLTCLGLVIAWRMESTQGFHAIMNLVLLPMWFLSGAFFPVQGAPTLLATLMVLNPLTYGLAALRHVLHGGGAEVAALPSLPLCLAVTIGFGAICLIGAAAAARRAASGTR